MIYKYGYGPLPRLALFLTIAVLFHACKPAERLALEPQPGGFSPSDITAPEVLSAMPNSGKTIYSLDGRARAQISRPGVSERAMVTFVSDRNQTLISLRNNLGIEGGRIYADRDSVTIYDRIEQQAWRADIDRSHELLLNGFSAFNLIDFIDPVLNADQVDSVFENEERYKLVFFDGKTVIFSRQDYLIEQIVFKAPDPEFFSTFVFENYAGLDGYKLPRTIRIFSQDGRSVIHLVTQTLEINRNNLDFDIGIPSDITINRL
jgi:hypothetical protein